MTVNPKIEEFVGKSFAGEHLTAEEIRILLEVEPHSLDAGFIMAGADTLNREISGNHAEVHAQIGINCAPCPNNCSFCAFAARNRIFRERVELSADEAVQMAHNAERAGANALFIMATGDYPFARFIEISQEIRARTAPGTTKIANVGDFDEAGGRALRDAGYAGIYHAVRMGEGRDTRIAPETRLRTVRAAREVGLRIGTCVEPVGPEHTLDEIVEKILIGRDMEPCYSGAMRRISIPGSDLEKYGMLTEYQAAFLVAVVRLAMGRNPQANCTHEPNLLGAASGANLFWAEVGTNPRDTEQETSKGRGLDVAVCRTLFAESDYDLVEGPSVFYGSGERV